MSDLDKITALVDSVGGLGTGSVVDRVRTLIDDRLKSRMRAHKLRRQIQGLGASPRFEHDDNDQEWQHELAKGRDVASNLIDVLESLPPGLLSSSQQDVVHASAQALSQWSIEEGYVRPSRRPAPPRGRPGEDGV